MNQSMIVERTNQHMSENNENSNNNKSATKSAVTEQDIKKIRVIQIDKPQVKKYRRMEEKDKILLDFLKIPY